MEVLKRDRRYQCSIALEISFIAAHYYVLVFNFHESISESMSVQRNTVRVLIEGTEEQVNLPTKLFSNLLIHIIEQLQCK